MGSPDGYAEARAALKSAGFRLVVVMGPPDAARNRSAS